MLEKCIYILRQELSLYCQLISLLQEEKKMLSTHATVGLYHLSNRIETLLYRIKEVEDSRIEMFNRLAVSYGMEEKGNLDGGGVTLSMVIETIEGPKKKELSTLQSTLVAVIDGIRELSRTNSIILRRGIENIKETFIFLRDISSNNTYSACGIMER